MIKFIFAGTAFCVVIIGCGAADKTLTVTDPVAFSCEARSDVATIELQRVIDANVSCTADSDCILIGFQTSCFVGCHDVVNSVGLTAVNAAIARINSNECSHYVEDGCAVNPPMPCAVPAQPFCNRGRCD